jgi:hypothetical protein
MFFTKLTPLRKLAIKYFLLILLLVGYIIGLATKIRDFSRVHGALYKIW